MKFRKITFLLLLFFPFFCGCRRDGNVNCLELDSIDARVRKMIDSPMRQSRYKLFWRIIFKMQTFPDSGCEIKSELCDNGANYLKYDEMLSKYGLRLICRDELHGGAFDAVDFSRIPDEYVMHLRTLDSGYFDLAKMTQSRNISFDSSYVELWRHIRGKSAKEMKPRVDVWIECLQKELQDQQRGCYDHRREYREIW